MGLETYIVLVKEYDFEIDGEDCTPADTRLLYRPFTVQAHSPEDAINKVSDRTGWLIKHAEFLNR